MTFLVGVAAGLWLPLITFTILSIKDEHRLQRRALERIALALERRS